MLAIEAAGHMRTLLVNVNEARPGYALQQTLPY